MRELCATAGVVLWAGSLCAQPAAPSKDPAAVQAGTYAIEPIHTRVLFAVSHMGFSTWYGNFVQARGALTLDPKNPVAAKLDVELPIGSVTTTNAKLDGELKSAQWLDAAKFPTAHFVSRTVVPKDGGTADVTGDLTLHGVTKPVTLHVSFNGAGVNPLDKHYTAGFEVRGTIHRSDFGVSKYVPLIGDDIELIISAPFERKVS